ncbi:MAG: hypothetical protein K2H55_08505, partial [Helicobacter sp.]|nr:hypothetical protein [Helicobacter sp.]
MGHTQKLFERLCHLHQSCHFDDWAMEDLFGYFNRTNAQEIFDAVDKLLESIENSDINHFRVLNQQNRIAKSSDILDDALAETTIVFSKIDGNITISV